MRKLTKKSYHYIISYMKNIYCILYIEYIMLFNIEDTYSYFDKVDILNLKVPPGGKSYHRN